MLRENEKGTQCSMHVLHSPGVPRRWYCIPFTRNVCDMICERGARLQASAADCVGQPYHPPSDVIVALLTGLAQLGTDRAPERGLACFNSRQSAGTGRILCGFFLVCACGRRRCSRSEPPSSASLFGEDFVCAGRRSMNASAEVFPPSPPPPPPALWRNRNNFF